VSVEHYENFPVASWLCPAPWRQAVLAIYRFARTADDIADEGNAPGEERRARLAAYTHELERAAAGLAPTHWPAVFEPLAAAMHTHTLPKEPFLALLSAFRQDTYNTPYPDRAALLDYCARSANPIGRLLLHLAGVADKKSIKQSDAVCSALQLINFWQDLGVDLRRGRCYVPQADAARHGLTLDALQPGADSAATCALVAELVAWSRGLMRQGAPLVHRVPGRFGWELRFVVQGGLGVLDKIEAGGHHALTSRPTLGAADWPRLGWRAWRMRAAVPGPAAWPHGAAP
jgi:hydroxysqualene synthase